MFSMWFTGIETRSLEITVVYTCTVVGACSDQYSYITHYFLSISIFVNYLSGCILRHATNSYIVAARGLSAPGGRTMY